MGMVGNHRHSRVLVSAVLFCSLLNAQSPRVHNAAELQAALKKLTVLGSALLVAAHPDDENTAFLATMTQGRLYRAAYLAMTRGEGGQNRMRASRWGVSVNVCGRNSDVQIRVHQH